VGIRQTINENPAIGAGIGIGIVVIAIGIIVWQFMGSSRTQVLTGPVTGDQAYYSDDDGKTFFADDMKKLTPFPHAGKEAVRAQVYRCSKGDPFVGYLERHTELAKQQKGMAMEMGNRPSFTEHAVFEVKKPGKNPWVPVDTKNFNQALQVMGVPCPDGATENPMILVPGQQQ
jgi:hypothetical protein